MPDADFARTPVDEFPEEVDLETEADLDIEPDSAAPAPAARPSRREGLPTGFRMRNSPHYVEHLFGGPIQAVRQVATTDLEETPPDYPVPPPLVESIRRFGLLQPLLVTSASPGGRQRVIDGVTRLAAARLAGLPTAPCLVIDADEERSAALRLELRRRSLPDGPGGQHPAQEAASDMPAGHDDRIATMLRLAFEEVNGLLRCLQAMLPLAGTGPEARFRGTIVRDLLLAEADRVRTLGAATALLTDTSEPATGGSGAPVDCAEVLAHLRQRLDPAARLKGVSITWPEAPPRAVVLGDAATLSTGWSSLLYAYLTVAEPGDRVAVTLEVPRIRPAAMFQLLLTSQSGTDRMHAAADLFSARPGADTSSAAILIEAATRSAGRFGGRFAQSFEASGVSALFVVPIPLDLVTELGRKAPTA